MCSQPKHVFSPYVSSQKQTEVDQNGPNWIEWEQSGPNRTKVGRIGQSRPM